MSASMLARIRALTRSVALAVLLASCGGGGGGDVFGETSLEVTPASLSFDAEQYGPLPAAGSVVATYHGDGLFAGYPVGHPVPGWLEMEFAPGTGYTRTLVVRVVSTSLDVGVHTTTVRILTGRLDGSQVVFRDVPVRLTVGPPADRSVSLTVTSLSFTSTEGLPPPPQTFGLTSAYLPASFTFEVAPRGGALAFLPAPAPLQVVSGPGEITVQPYGRPIGSYAADLVIRDSLGMQRARLPIDYEVTAAYSFEGPIRFSVTHAAALADLEKTITIHSLVDAATGSRYRWAVSGAPSWMTVSPVEGDLAADVPVAVRIDRDTLWTLQSGSLSALLTLSFTQGGARTLQSFVFLDFALAPALVLDPVEIPVGGTTDPGGLVRSVTVSSNLGDAFSAYAGGWTAAEGASWLAVTPSGAVGDPITLEVLPGALPALANGAHTATLTLTPSSPRLVGTSSEVRLALTLAAVERVYPYVTWAGRADEVNLGGNGFGAPGPVAVSFGGVVATGEVMSDTEVRVRAPASAVAAPGTVPVAIENALGIDRGASELKVLPAPAYAAAAVPLGRIFDRMVLDPERRAVLLTNRRGAPEVRRLRFAGGAWVSDAFPLSIARGTAVSVDGSTILAAAGATFLEETFVELDPDTLTPRKSTTYADGYSTYDLVAPLADGRTLIVNTEQWADSIWYPSLASGPHPYPGVFAPFMLLTRDRRRLILRGREYSDTQVLDAGAAGFIPVTVSATTNLPGHWSVSGNGGRLLAGKQVRDRAFVLLGELVLPEAELGAVALSPDGQWAYTVGRTAAGQPWVFRRTDVSGTGPYVAEDPPLALAVPTEESVSLLQVSDDGGTLFLLALAQSGLETVFHALQLP